MAKNNLYIFGDSILRGVIWDEAAGRYRFSKALDMSSACAPLQVMNRAKFGCTIDKGISIVRDTLKRKESMKYAIVEYGGNDCDLDWQAVSDRPDLFHDGKTPLPEFGRLLRTFAREARMRGLRPVLVLPPPLFSARYFEWVSRGRDREAILRYLGDVEHIGRWHALYVEAIRQAAADTDSPVLDFYTPFLRAMNFPELMCLDGIHPSAAGQKLMAETALNTLARRTVSVCADKKTAPRTALKVFA